MFTNKEKKVLKKQNFVLYSENKALFRDYYYTIVIVKNEFDYRLEKYSRLSADDYKFSLVHTFEDILALL